MPSRRSTTLIASAPGARRIPSGGSVRDRPCVRCGLKYTQRTDREPTELCFSCRLVDPNFGNTN